MSAFRLRPTVERRDAESIREALDACATPLPSVYGATDEADAALEPLMDRIGDASFILLGEASHGTSEYYLWRRRITERLIRERGFDFVAVEGDWPDCMRVNRFVRDEIDGAPEEVLKTFRRWPTWMWANEEIAGLMTALREINADRPKRRRVGFYGLDVYSLWDSLARIREYLKEYAPESLGTAEDAFACFGSEFGDEQGYARRTRWVPDSCEQAVLDLLAKTREATLRDGEHAFDAVQNALAARHAEEYYRTMTSPGPESWNVRDRHMTETLARLLDRHSDPAPGGRRAKAIVWEHNTHIGDARATDMARAGMVNVGQLSRDRFGAGDCVLVGFGSRRGSVIAGRKWGGPMERMPLPEAREESWEDLMHEAFDGEDRLLIFPDDDETAAPLHDRRGHRAVGVVYRPESERGNYVPSDLAARYDAFVYVDRTHALRPLHEEPVGKPDDVPETYPSGV
ncbi:erythromycin esterase family protein [Alienimonas californiensis]|uniref:Erythromycin esterase n=1 Tax=Alienimonas californiensis TaxID=2527989 RepID=A0A517PBF8_9PLAN|nr:erythromycin esterase family protein [Alienimonas californiensis]QDT16713.1 Erythromycin esterase [Alienimonas californiensis]